MGPVTSHPELHQTVILEAGCALACVAMGTIFRMASSPQRALLSLQADNLQGRLGRVLSSSVSYGNVPSSHRTRLSFRRAVRHILPTHIVLHTGPLNPCSQ